MEPGERLGPYEIVAFIGAGGMGEVWRARDTRLEREVALKVLPASTLADPTARARLLREARMASQLNHPNVCTIHEVGESDGRAYIAMELVEGRSLASLLAGGGLPAEQVLKLGLQLADALAHAHERGVVHRDLKSGNVNVTLEGRVKVLDFGLAKRLASEDLAKATTLTQASLTEAGAIVGTLAYMAPEQLRGEGADARSDVWALGVVLYEMAAGRRPFRGDTSYELSSAILSQPPAPLPATVPGPLAAVIERCLGKAPAQRYQRGGEVRAALEAVASGETLPPWPALRAWVVVPPWADSADLRERAARRARGTGRRRRAEPSARRTRRRAGDPHGGAAVCQPVGRPAAGLPLGRLDAGDDRAARAAAPGDVERDRPHLGDALQEDRDPDRPDREGAGGAVRARGERAAGGWPGPGVGGAHPGARTRRNSGRTASSASCRASSRSRATSPARSPPPWRSSCCPPRAGRLANARSVNPEAYDAYLKAASYWVRLTPQDLDTAERLLTVALEKDPGYARGYAGIALVWACRQQLGYAKPGEAGPKARAAARRAVELDDSVAEAHFALADILTWTDWDWAAAAREWERAVELGPADAVAIATYSHYLTIVGRREEAMRQIERAVELDPFNALTVTFYSIDLYCARRYDEAIAQARKALSLQPDSPIALGALMLALHATKQHDEMIATAEKYYAGMVP